MTAFLLCVEQHAASYHCRMCLSPPGRIRIICPLSLGCLLALCGQDYAGIYASRNLLQCLNHVAAWLLLLRQPNSSCVLHGCRGSSAAHHT